MSGVSFVEESLVVGWGAVGEGVADFDESFLGEEYHVGSETDVPDAFFLEMTESENTAGEDGPEFGFGE